MGEIEKPFVSSRAVEEEIRRYKYQTFDRLIDLALDGVVEMPQAIQAFKEELEGEFNVQTTAQN